MPLQKQGINISFGQGLDTKSDPFQVEPGKFLQLENSVFNKFKQLTKRNGFAELSTLSNPTAQVITTFKDNLTAIGTTIQALIPGTSTWADRGNFQPVDLSVQSIVKTSTNQSQADAVVAPNGLVCTVYTDQVTNSSGVNVPTHKYVITDKETGQTVVAPTTLSTTAATGTPKVYVYNMYFMILFVNASTLNYITIGYENPTTVVSSGSIGAVDLTYAISDFSATPVWDAVVVKGTTPSADIFCVAFNSSPDLTLKFTYTIGSSIIFATPITIVASGPTGQRGQLFNLSYNFYTVGNVSIPKVCITWYDYVAGTIKSVFIRPGESTYNGPYTLYSASPGTITITNITAATKSDSVYTTEVFYQLKNSYAYDSTVRSDAIYKRTVTTAGAGTAPSAALIRSVGIASKAFIVDASTYLLSAYQSAYQSGYYLLNATGSVADVIGKLAYTNGGGYAVPGALPNVNIDDVNASMCYLYKSTVTPVNKETNVSSTTQVAGIYAQLGVNLATFDLTADNIRSSEIGENLNLTGGFIAAYDGQQITEQGFFVYPENLAATNPINIVVTGNTNSSTTISNLSSTTNIAIGMNITGSGIPASTTVTSISGSSITISNAATATATGVSLTFTGNIANNTYYYTATYEWQDAQGNLFRSAPAVPIKIVTSSTGKFNVVNVPTLRLTYKIDSPVKLVLYRWSLAQQTYYQVTSVTRPILNNTAGAQPTVDYISIVDYSSDAQILGNSILYTTGNVLENISPPASNLMTLFNNRLWLVDSENRNLLWFSKPVFDDTPVEMSDLLTIYVAPSIASQGSTGVITAISPMDDKLVIFKKNSLGYISGQGPDSAGLYSQYSEFTLINSVVGCSQQQSIVFMPQGLMFQSDQGIWLLGRDLSTNYIGAPVEEYTQGATVLSAINVPGTTQVRFTLDTGVTLMYDYFFQQWGAFTNIPAISSTVYENLHTYLYTTTTGGQLFARISQETPGQYLDNGSPVLMRFKTSWMNFAGVQGFERFYQMYLLGKYLTPFKLNVEIGYNYNSNPQQATIVTPQEYGGTWGEVSLWGGGNTWGNTPDANVFEARLFPQIQKCESFQITMTELFDNSFSTTPGAGLTLSGMNLVVGMKKGYRTSTAAKSFG